MTASSLMCCSAPWPCSNGESGPSQTNNDSISRIIQGKLSSSEAGEIKSSPPVYGAPLVALNCCFLRQQFVKLLIKRRAHRDFVRCRVYRTQVILAHGLETLLGASAGRLWRAPIVL